MQRSIISAAIVIHCEEQQQDGILPPSDIIIGGAMVNLKLEQWES
jgi:hypothetical protein